MEVLYGIQPRGRGLDVAGPPQPGNNNGPLGEAPIVASQPRSRKGRPKVTGAPGHRYQQPCPTCGKVFGSSSALAKHKLIHSNERRHKCILCAKSFKRQDHLTGHMLTHRSKKPYECAVDNCGKSYCDIRSLRRHFESQHPGLVMEDNMNYTGDEKDPELMAAEAAAVQANRHSQVMMRGSPGADFALGLGNPQDLNQSSSSQDTNDSPGSSSSAALQSLALAAQRVQNTPDPPPSQGQLSSQDMSTLYRLDSYTSQMFGGNLPSMSQSLLTGGVSGSMATSIPGGGPRELSIQVPNPKFQGLSLSSGTVGLSGNGMLPHQSPGSNRFSSQSGPDLGISPKSSSNKRHTTHEKERVTVNCTVCKRTFKSMPALNGHMRLHGGYNNARADVTPKVSPSKPEEKPPLPTAASLSQPRPLAHPSNVNPPMNMHTQLPQVQSSQAMGQHRPLRMVGQSVTPPTTMHLSSVYTNTTTSHVPSWPEYRHPRPHTVMSGGKPSYLPNLSLNMLQDELTTLAHTAVGLAAQSQPLQKPPVQMSQPHHQPPQHHPLHHTTPLPTDRIQPVHPFNSRMPIGSKPLQMYNNQVNQIIPKEEPMPYPPTTSMGSPSPPKLESMLKLAQEQQIRSNEMPQIGHAIPPILDSKDESRLKENVFRDPPPVLPTATKRKQRPPSLFIPSWASNMTPGGNAPSTYPSQMRSPREIGVLYRSNSSSTPPPYTPPPMLSPIRSGSGLYFSVGSGSMPPSAAVTVAVAVTPKSAFPPSTPSMLQMHRRGSISSSTEESDFVFPSEPHINVGGDYQAAVPELVKNKEELEAPDWREGKLVWDPAIEQKYSEVELTDFLKLATTPALTAGARNIEYAHHCLYRADGDIELALLMILNGNPMVADEFLHMADYKYDFSEEWTVAERKLFRDMYKTKGKDFHEIAKGIPTKTVRDCVEYYYWWKKLYPYNHDMQKYCHHSGANPNEESRKNECDLYPGETFLDYVPLKEYRHDKYYRGGSSNPKNNNSVKPSSTTNQEDKPAAQQGSFVCNYPHCDASFKSRQALNGHIRVHGGSYKPNAATSNASTNNSSRTTTSSSASSTSSSYRGGGGVGQNTKQMPPESSSDEMSNEEEEEESDEGSSRELSENERDDDDDDGMTSEDDHHSRYPGKMHHRTFDKVKSRNVHMRSHHAADKKDRMGYGGGKEQQMFNHYMEHDSRSCSSSEEDEEEEDDEEEGMDDDGMEDDDEMLSTEDEEDDDMSN
ncbi:transcriptional-regulating factor 1-like isoform X1 [Lytechinus pictus]|uniref:transcriptional-regulating factor 1-like isoform X1 n=1 Tax=Lytechinus pictus TaxID=7653 RepID=UPI0030B9B4D4